MTEPIAGCGFRGEGLIELRVLNGYYASLEGLAGHPGRRHHAPTLWHNNVNLARTDGRNE